MTDVSQRFDLPVGSIGRHANGWWGMMMLIVTEGALFVYLLFAYYYTAVQHGRGLAARRRCRTSSCRFPTRSF